MTSLSDWPPLKLLRVS